MKVFVVEDTDEIRKRLIALLRRLPGVSVSGEADSVRGALAMLPAADMDAMLLDLQLGDGSGLDVLAAVKSQRPEVRVIVVSNFANAQYRSASLAAGADAFLDKSNEAGRIGEILSDWNDRIAPAT
jgi:two-component system, NarL family, response regulator DevR